MKIPSFRIPGLLGVLLWSITAFAESPVERGYFGYVATHEEAQPNKGQIHVLEVHKGGPAERAGLQAGDRIHKVNGNTFHFENDLQMIRQFTKLRPGERVILDLRRDGDPQQVTLTVGRQPASHEQRLSRWMQDAEEWFEQGGAEECRAHRSRLGIYQDLERRVAEQDLRVTMFRRIDTEGDVKYVTTGGEVLLLGQLRNPFLDALAGELPSGASWDLLMQSAGVGNGLIVVPQSGPRVGRRGLISGSSLGGEMTAQSKADNE